MAEERRIGLEDPEGGETFFSRWSRVKTGSRDTATSRPGAPPEVAPAKADPDSAQPELPPVEDLTLESDFSRFFHPKVDEGMRRAALRKLFSDPHFNVMDGLDVYIDDYSKTEPIPAAMLASLKHAQRIIQWAAEKKEDAPASGSIATGEPPQDAASAALPEPDTLNTVPPDALASDGAPIAAAPQPEPDAGSPKT